MGGGDSRSLRVLLVDRLAHACAEVGGGAREVLMSPRPPLKYGNFGWNLVLFISRLGVSLLWLVYIFSGPIASQFLIDEHSSNNSITFL